MSIAGVYIDPRALVAQFEGLQARGFAELFRSGQIGTCRALGTEVVALFHSGREDLFIHTEPAGALFRGLPAGFNFPNTLALRGPLAELVEIQAKGGGDSRYLRLDRLLVEGNQVTEACLQGAYQTLADETAAPSTIIGIKGRDSRVRLTRGGEFLLAARDRGDTHLLVSVRERGHEASAVEPEDVQIIPPTPPQTRTQLYQRALAGMEPQEALETIKRSSSFPELLTALTGLIDMDNHLHAARITLFLEMLVRHGFCHAVRPLPPEKTLVAVVGFGDELETIRLFLDCGYQVVAVEDFSDTPTSTSKTALSIAEVRTQLAAQTCIEQLRIMDFRDPRLRAIQAQVVLSAAVVDECYPTLIDLCAPNGIIAITDSGQLDRRRQNFDVDRADSFIDRAQKDGLYFTEIYSDLIPGEGALKSDFLHPRGQNSYLVKRAR